MLVISNNAMGGITCQDVNGNNIDASDTYIFSMKQNNITYAPAIPFSDYALDGWMFRINGKLPLESLDGDPDSGGPYGTDIANTPISNGDVIHFYWNYPYNETSSSYYSVKYVSADVSYTGTTLSGNLVSAYSYFDNSMYWHISLFSNYAPGTALTATVYDISGAEKGTGTVDSSGSIEVSNLSLTSGQTYYLKVPTTTYRGVDGYDENYDSITWQILNTTMAYVPFTA